MNRIKSIDYVKGICLLLVYIGHCGINVTHISVFSGSFLMPAFFLFSGYLFSYKTNIKKTIMHKTKTLYVVYLMWTIIPSSILYLIGSLSDSLSIIGWIKMTAKIVVGIEIPKQVGQLWFILALFSTEMIWIILDRIFSKQIVKYYSAFLIGLLGVILNILNIKIGVFRLGTAFVMLPIFVLGIIAKRNKTNKYIIAATKMKPVLLLGASFCWIVLCLLHYVILKSSISPWRDIYGFFPLFYINAVLGTLIFVSISKYLLYLDFFPIRIINNVFCFFGQNSTTALVTLNILIYLIQNLLHFLPHFNEIDGQLSAVIVFLIVAVLQIPIARIFKNKHLCAFVGRF